MNILLHRIEMFLGKGAILAYPNMNVYSYLFIRRLILESKQEFYEHPNLRFPVRPYVASFWDTLKQNLISMAKISAQTIASGLLGRHEPFAKEKKKIFSINRGK